MRFKKIVYQNRTSGSQASLVNSRLEYFLHYWTFILQENSRWIFFSHERLESHRSLFTKINVQLTQNRKHYPKRIRELVIRHPFFSSGNILVKQSKATQSRLATFAATFPPGDRDNNSQYLVSTRKQLTSIQHLILGKDHETYMVKVLRQLIRILCQDKKMSEKNRGDLRFLVNAVIVELYYAGYAIEYIRKVPDIILYPQSHKDDFPFDKFFADFTNQTAYEQYKSDALTRLTLKKQIASIINLVRRPKTKGHFVFRVDNFNFQQENPLQVWDVTFYNPQKSLKLKYGSDKRLDEYVDDIERYFEQFVKARDRKKLRSHCNAIVPVEFRPQFWNYVDPAVYKAMEKVNNSLSVLKHLKRLHVGGYSFDASINLKTVIVTNQDMRYQSAPAIVNDYDDVKPFKIKNAASSSVEDYLKWAHRLNANLEFHKKVIAIYVAVNRYRHNPFSFSFRDFWITICDPLFPNNPSGFIDFCCRCVELYLNDQYLTNVKIFLRDGLNSGGFSAGTYSLSKSKIKSLGLEIELYKPIRARSFSKQYTKLEDHLQFDFLNDVVKEVDGYVTNRSVFMDKIKTRLRTMLLEVYAERNLEVHNNISTDMSMVKLRDFCITIAVILRLVISQKVTKRTKSIEDLHI